MWYNLEKMANEMSEITGRLDSFTIISLACVHAYMLYQWYMVWKDAHSGMHNYEE